MQQCIGAQLEATDVHGVLYEPEADHKQGSVRRINAIRAAYHRLRQSNQWVWVGNLHPITALRMSAFFRWPMAVVGFAKRRWTLSPRRISRLR